MEFNSVNFNSPTQSGASEGDDPMELGRKSIHNVRMESERQQKSHQLRSRDDVIVEFERQRKSDQLRIRQLEDEVSAHERSRDDVIVEFERQRKSDQLRIRQLEDDISAHERSKVDMMKAIKTADKEISDERSQKLIETAQARYKEYKDHIAEIEEERRKDGKLIDKLKGELELSNQRLLKLAAKNTQRSKDSVNLKDYIRPDTVERQYGRIQSGSRIDLLRAIEGSRTESSPDTLKICVKIFMHVYHEMKKEAEQLLRYKSDDDIADIKRTFRSMETEHSFNKAFIRMKAEKARESFPELESSSELSRFIRESVAVCWAMQMLARSIMPIEESGQFDEERAFKYAQCKRSSLPIVDFSVWPTLVLEEDPEEIIYKGMVYLKPAESSKRRRSQRIPAERQVEADRADDAAYRAEVRDESNINIRLDPHQALSTPGSSSQDMSERSTPEAAQAPASPGQYGYPSHDSGQYHRHENGQYQHHDIRQYHHQSNV